MKFFPFIVLSILATAFMFGTCNKDYVAPATDIQVKLTAEESNAQQINLQVKEVKVNFSDDTSWTSLNVNQGVYNLQDYQNGRDTLIAEGKVKATRIVKDVLLILGDNNTVKIDNEVFPLTIPATASNGLKVTVNTKLNQSTQSFTLDLNAGLSIASGNDNYLVNPVLKLK